MLAEKSPSVQANREQFDRILTALARHYGPSAKRLPSGQWLFEVDTGRRRSQVVHVTYKEHTTDGPDKPRIVALSPIGPVPRRLDRETLLRRNATLNVGAICIEDFRNEEGKVVPYLTLRASRLVATADNEEVWEMVQKVARVADELEKDIYAQDQY